MFESSFYKEKHNKEEEVDLILLIFLRMQHIEKFTSNYFCPIHLFHFKKGQTSSSFENHHLPDIDIRSSQKSHNLYLSSWIL